MGTLTLPAVSTTTGARSRASLVADIQTILGAGAAAFTDSHYKLAIKRALTDCLPLGSQVVLSASANGDATWTVAARIGKLLRLAVGPQTVALGRVRVTNTGDTQTTLHFPIAPAAGRSIVAEAFVVPPLPDDPNAAINFGWPELLLSYAVYELYAMRQEAGALADTQETVSLATSWRMQADMQKQSLMPAVPEKKGKK